MRIMRVVINVKIPQSCNAIATMIRFSFISISLYIKSLFRFKHYVIRYLNSRPYVRQQYNFY